MPTAAVYDCDGPYLSNEERAFFRDVDPWGFIFFARHCENPEQMRALCAELRDAVGRDAPIMIDQEGGRVARMRTVQHEGWVNHPPMGVFGALWRLNPQTAQDAAWLNGYLLGKMVFECGVNIDCVPMLDVRQIDSDPVTLSDRAFAMHADIVAPLGHATMAGLAAGGALPVIKHLPGLGRAQCDSHKELPTVCATHKDLAEVDFLPFGALKDAPMGMTAHIVYEAIDPERCATYSATVIENIIRTEIGFDGLLFTDDLKMEALGDAYPVRAQKALNAGCDIALACNFSLEEKQLIAEAVPALTGKSGDRAKVALSWSEPVKAPDLEKNFATLERLLKPVWPFVS